MSVLSQTQKTGGKNTKFWGWLLNIFYLVYIICSYRIKNINMAKCHCSRIVIQLFPQWVPRTGQLSVFLGSWTKKLWLQ